jgi:hypothetical protein
MPDSGGSITVRTAQLSFGHTWSEILQFARRIEAHGDLRVETIWEDPSSTTERERLETELLRQKLSSEFKL